MSGPIGFFDSGVGGLTVLRAAQTLLPDVSTHYLGDNARAPYGTRTQDEIFTFALDGARYLFNQGCPLIVFACNTASAGALRRIQQEVLPAEFPNRRILGVVRPGAEALTAATHSGRVAVFGTNATIASHAYSREITHLRPDAQVTEIACPTLAGLIERGEEGSVEARAEITAACRKAAGADAALLACTHYAFVADAFRAALPGVTVLTQEAVIADKLAAYLVQHPDMAACIDHSGSRRYDTTGSAESVSALASRFLGASVAFKHISLP
ncbi:MAG: glutamate racemase [Patescibacteria group bacterium]